MTYNSYITDLHLNLHPNQIDLLDKWYEHSKKVSDFFTIAYYPYHMIEVKNGYKTEEEIDFEKMHHQWGEIKKFLNKKNKEDNFISFLGYEWQGAGLDGDHNIYFQKDTGDILLPKRYEELVNSFKGREVIGIPHHLGYSVGNRGKNWLTHNEEFSPLVEIYSHHGSSEKDQTNLAMDRHIHMGPRVDGGTVLDGLKQGYHFGVIASGDNHEIPALVKNGRAGVWAESYTKESIWNAFKERRTFGFTDSRITVWTELEGHPMGSIISTNNKKSQMYVSIVANSCVERIELYKNTQLIDIYIPKSSCKERSQKETVCFKFKLECGWGPNVKIFPNVYEKNWKGTLKTEGKIKSVESIFNSFDNTFNISTDQRTVDFNCKSQKNTDTDHWMRDGSMKNEGYIFEIEAPITSEIQIDLDGEKIIYSVLDILQKSHLFVFEKEARKLVKNLSDLQDFYRSDGWYHNAYKAKIYQGFVKEAYEVETYFEVVPPLIGEESYFVKVFQSDGQVAWGSPIWLKNIEE
ncbi:DUF3604 domain-containing protein [Vagococcus humatus]|uniref:DUF3604 domain-containing protein n=1 Tax=Vagococcus humatus TaxID=1889241 RepID=A0A429Z5V4_9ENTE|nr:DUF3604 domain-containing protein [Vagococcus humatus]RST89076.1 hypothetical protein C7P63_07245 [Vagococcus humatus]